MRMILVILMIITGLAYLSQNQSIKHNKKTKDFFYIALVVFMVLLVGLRTSYNDTYHYMVGFRNSVNFQTFISNPENINIMNNPLFYGFQALIKSFTDNVSILFMICAIYVNINFVRFIKKYSDAEGFALSMFIYVCLGTLMLSMAAQKQVLAMATLTIAIDALIEKKYMKYYIVVFLAGLIHTYAWLFFFLPILGDKPWNIYTYLMLVVTMFIMYYFQNAIASFVEVADSIGKDIVVEEVLDGYQMNILRVAVYAIVPLTAFVFQNRLFKVMDRKHGILIQMCTVSLMFMLMGTMNGANMFGRCANYFEIGMIVTLPWLVKQLFNKQSTKILLSFAIVCFIGFFIYDNQGFGWMYQYKNVLQFLRELIFII